jgi:ketosteroid isomerase-like protein
MGNNDVERLVESYGEGWLGHDVDAIMAVVSDDVVFHNLTAGERVEGAEAFRAHVAGICERWPDLSFQEHERYLTDDTGVVEWTVPTSLLPEHERHVRAGCFPRRGRRTA